MGIVESLAWLDSHLDHESSSVGVAAGKVEGLGLAAMSELVSLLGDPQDAVPTIHVTGTNGKGSVTAMVVGLLQAHGLSVGSYTSPHLARINERLRRDGEPIDDETLSEVLDGLRAVEPLMSTRPTWFELVTAAAFRWFAEAPVDVAVVEVGLLGRYDATNVVDGQVAVITGVGGDHTDFRPGWELAVAGEKAGIIGPDSTAVLGRMAPELREVFRAEGPAALVAEEVDFEVLSSRPAVGGRLIEIAGLHGRYDEIFLPLHGDVQAHNAAVAVAAVESFFDRELDGDLVRDGLALVRLEGRVEVVSRQPLVILDGAHNPDALRALGATLDEEFAAIGTRTVVLGLLAGRDPDQAVESVATLRPDLVLCTTADPDDRGLPAAELAAACERAGLAHEAVATPEEAVARAIAIAQEEDMVVVTGSFRLIDPARRIVAAAAQD
jgi:dihydrofolate synthase/folylpolyglutamate synthase